MLRYSPLLNAKMLHKPNQTPVAVHLAQSLTNKFWTPNHTIKLPFRFFASQLNKNLVLFLLLPRFLLVFVLDLENERSQAIHFLEMEKTATDNEQLREIINWNFALDKLNYFELELVSGKK